ncbi:hypothetical protein M407DRAFT_8823 [Tulasnella calospora MUT 4182]|uniref:Delta 8-(E)-sphingolipid desaturase n=1 Tax=Tulasnella calospora MUT 4182 TaxID=1051891 RepID=A0A0C3QGM5_9AGAM|nr:hypothetical protein M407DRAFT_8823 [Tulasnella calospora MUT 4182]
MNYASLRTWTRDEVAQRILAGDTLVIYDGFVLRVTQNWLASHPGGALAILHFVGRDATDEINAYHAEPTLKRVMGFAVGKIDLDKKVGWEPLVPPVQQGWLRQGGEWHREASAVRNETPSSEPTAVSYMKAPSEILLVAKERTETSETGPTLECITPPPVTLSAAQQADHARAYRELHARITAAGLYQTRYLAGYGPEVLRYTFGAVLAYETYQRGWYLLSAFLMGLVWHQLTFFAHDLGHMGVTHNWVIDRLLGILVANLCGGLSIGWWVDNHNIHHLVTNHPSHDPDIQHVPFFAISPVFLSNLYSSYYHRIMKIDAVARFFIPFQHKIYFLVMSLARFNLYANSYGFLAFRARKDWTWFLEIFCTGVYWTWFGRALWGTGGWKMRIAYLLISHVTPSPLHVQIVLSHFARSTTDLGPAESFVARQLRTTTDVICDDSVAFIHGGLHLQVTHHLFPRLPRHNLRAASFMVKEFAKEQGLEYAEFGFTEGNGEVLSVLKEVAQQARIVQMVASEEVKHAVEKGCPPSAPRAT